MNELAVQGRHTHTRLSFKSSPQDGASGQHEKELRSYEDAIHFTF